MDLKQFLQSPFSKDNFVEFISDRFYGFSENYYIEDGYLGKVKLDDKSEIGFFVFEVSDNKDIENTRVGFHKELKKYADENLLDGAIGAFYHPNQKVWRLSFIRFSYDDKHKKQVTSQKRFTFLLGNDKTKTAFEQLKNLKYPKIAEIEKAFGVEAVTKEFYKGLIKEYEKLLSDYLIYPSNDDNSKKEFAIRLIGRILFIKFLNKKSLVPDDIFEVANGYYHDKLEPLFFEQLNTPKSERKEEFKNDSIPFLNGGLFEPLYLDYYEYNEISKCSQYINTLKIDDKFFKELYEHLNQYNFTIDENSIEDSELSIDPEMLGRIFENLLAEINPETRQNARKSTGSYYTPREIVDYMVSSSLLEYLKTKTSIDEETLKTIIFKNEEPQNDYDKAKLLSAIFELKILDPACGSGAFPMGLLQKIVKILNLIDEDASIWFKLQTKEFIETHKGRNIDYLRKLNIIKNTIYGIDIQPIAIEISKLRFFLSLIVDEEGEPEPLPNLEFKFVCANSLLPKPKNTQLASLEYFMLENDLINLKNEYFEASGERKKDIRKEYIQVQKKMFEEEEATNLLSALNNNLTNYNPFDPVSVAGFFDSVFMFNVKDGFDIVIGNPPYIRQEKIKDLKPLLQKSNYKSYNGTADIYVYFFEQGHRLLKEGGNLSFITSNKYTRAKYGKEFRKFILENSKILEYIDFNGVKVFESATVDTSILSFRKNGSGTLVPPKNNNGEAEASPPNSLLYCDVKGDYKGGDLKEYCQKNGFSYSQSDLSIDSFSFANPKELEIKKKIEHNSLRLVKICNINRGLVTGDNKGLVLNNKDEIELFKSFDIRNQYIKKYIFGKDISKYSHKIDKHLIAIPKGTILKEDNPLIIKLKERDKQFDYSISKRNEKGLFWYDLRGCSFYDIFSKDIIIWSDIVKTPSFSITNGDVYVDTSAYFLDVVNPEFRKKYILAILNSKISYYFMLKTASTLGESSLRWKKIFVEQLPIPKITETEQQPFIDLVDKIMELKKMDCHEANASRNDEVTELENKIDEMVYKLYGLSEDEIRVVEGRE